MVAEAKSKGKSRKAKGSGSAGCQPAGDGSLPSRTSQHTPGPWFIAHDGSAAVAAEPDIIIETNDRHIAFCFGIGPNNDTQAVADYHLIAAAPELLDALKDIVRQFEKSRVMVGPDLADSIRVFGKQAIAKAEGDRS